LPKFSSNSLKLNILQIAQWVKCIPLLPKLLPQKTKDYPIFKGSLIQKRAQTFALIYNRSTWGGSDSFLKSWVTP
jgi:hypothetical protein